MQTFATYSKDSPIHLNQSWFLEYHARLTCLASTLASAQMLSKGNAILRDMDKAKILQAAQTELQRHTWGTFVDEGLTITLGGQGIVTPGCGLAASASIQPANIGDTLLKTFCRGFWVALLVTSNQRRFRGAVASLFIVVVVLSMFVVAPVMVSVVV
jgi:hypothetical protein